MQQLQLWEKGVLKESDYKNHGIFTLKYISNNLVPVSVKLKSSCSKLSQGARKVIERAERQLLQDRVRGINKTIEGSGNNINNSRSKLASMVAYKTDLDRCSRFIKKVREDRYGKVKDRQVRKFHNLFNKSKNKNNRLGQINNGSNLERPNNNSSNNNNNTSQLHDNNNKWVINLCETRLTEGQMSVLAKGPNFAITPKYIPNVDYITAVESMCCKLKEEDAMDKDRVIPTADKGVAMVIMDRKYYISKVQELLAQPAYRPIPRDPINKVKAQLITKLSKLKRKTTWMRVPIWLCILLAAFPLTFMGYQKSIKLAISLGQ